MSWPRGICAECIVELGRLVIDEPDMPSVNVPCARCGVHDGRLRRAIPEWYDPGVLTPQNDLDRVLFAEPKGLKKP